MEQTGDVLLHIACSLYFIHEIKKQPRVWLLYFVEEQPSAQFGTHGYFITSARVVFSSFCET
jgi:hypothetical protein